MFRRNSLRLDQSLANFLAIVTGQTDILTFIMGEARLIFFLYGLGQNFFFMVQDGLPSGNFNLI